MGYGLPTTPPSKEVRMGSHETCNGATESPTLRKGSRSLRRALLCSAAKLRMLARMPTHAMPVPSDDCDPRKWDLRRASPSWTESDCESRADFRAEWLHLRVSVAQRLRIDHQVPFWKQLRVALQLVPGQTLLTARLLQNHENCRDRSAGDASRYSCDGWLASCSWLGNAMIIVVPGADTDPRVITLEFRMDLA